ncbi:MAG TPA: biopolymer transporter ExbD [Longimicrobiales bacterium]|nr:biopolymer transporter ExbD [Longimicrobiales bacterium]
MPLMKKRDRPSGDIPTASMADIAFLLLVFFLVTTVFEEEKGLPIVLPEAQEEVEVSQKNVLHLVIQPNGIVEVKRGESPQIQPARASEISAIWRSEFSRNPNLIAAVKTHPNASYRLMVDVLDQLQTAGAERVSLQILEG